MKPQTPNSAVLSIRCAYRSSAGRQCRLTVSDARSGLCLQHRTAQMQMEAADHYAHLTRNYHDFQTAQGINHSLHSLYELLAQNHISPRRAAVLSYISSLLLRTLPQIDADKAAGIFDPTKPRPINVAVRDEDADSDEDEDSDLDPDSDSDSGSDPKTDTDSDSDSGSDAGANPDSANTWDASIPEPDPKKKPS